MKTISTNKARQGRKGLRVLVILIISLILAGLVWIAVEIYGETYPVGNFDEGTNENSSAPQTQTLP